MQKLHLESQNFLPNINFLILVKGFVVFGKANQYELKLQTALYLAEWTIGSWCLDTSLLQ